MDYCINKTIFKRRLVELGFRGVSDFSNKTGLHRNTVQNLLAGQSVISSSFFKVASTLRADPLELIQAKADLPRSIKGGDEVKGLVGQIMKEDKKMAVFLLGSRALGKAKKYSDWDLGVIRYPEPISGREFLRLKVKVEEWSDSLIRTVDLVNLNVAPEWFLGEMRSQPVFLAGNTEAAAYFLGILDGIKKRKVA
ncbi:MAG: nucleotidyltransferase domain-containing protein [Deltaproteobacteria bacterium]|nr:nucleotidyltransferase domain-containing protein [Deltaproteobacteria bacterium]